MCLKVLLFQKLTSPNIAHAHQYNYLVFHTHTDLEGYHFEKCVTTSYKNKNLTITICIFFYFKRDLQVNNRRTCPTSTAFWRKHESWEKQASVATPAASFPDQLSHPSSFCGRGRKGGKVELSEG